MLFRSCFVTHETRRDDSLALTTWQRMSLDECYLNNKLLPFSCDLIFFTPHFPLKKLNTLQPILGCLYHWAVGSRLFCSVALWRGWARALQLSVLHTFNSTTTTTTTSDFLNLPRHLAKGRKIFSFVLIDTFMQDELSGSCFTYASAFGFGERSIRTDVDFSYASSSLPRGPASTSTSALYRSLRGR